MTDYVIVGAGSAGCVLANRLSENPKNTVTLLEAGDADRSMMIHVPIASGDLIRRGAFGWNFHTEPEPALGDRRIFWPRGKVLGGCSSINGQVYIRGHRSDFDHWAQLGNSGWSHDELLPYFRRSEGHADRNDPAHGRDGELRITRAAMENPLFDAFVQAGGEAGYPATDDFNGAQQEGFGRFDFTTWNGRRQSSAVAFLRPAKGRPNLRVVKHAHVTRVVIHDGRAVAVEARVRGRPTRFAAAREVILSAGVVGSPHVLMLSGIGAGAALSAQGISVQTDLPGVGGNLQDHVQSPLMFACNAPLTMHQLIRMDRAALRFAQALFLRSGPFAHFPVQGGAFTRSRPGLEVPDTQWHFGIALGMRRARWPSWKASGDPFDRDGFTLAPCLLRPQSRGRISLASSDPDAAPRIEARYLSAEADRLFFRDVLRDGRRIAGQPALSRYVAAELRPGDAVQSDDEIDAYVRETLATCHHQVGTCKMGVDPQAVVDPQLRVRGVAGLRVADASIMPTLVGGNTNAAAIMIGEKASDLVLGKAA
ncbi:choline dehydrogenase [Mameliella alba]|nr:choline dehydrogenase [Mameliella alba]MBY6171775.1 choline dehydrogenase [Mameliella alba]MBY6177000.1 choline dehydrogenase [Mameliella alba]